MIGEKFAVQESETNEVLRKISRRLLPLLFVSYFFAFLDRINVGYAQLQMKADLGFSDAVYGLGAGIFFISYLLFEVPSNLWLQRIGARLTLLRIMLLWGVTSAATMLVRTPTEFYVVRFLLGAFEAGFFPGIILYLTYWFPSTYRASVTGKFMFAVPMAGMVGGPISGLIMSSMQGVAGLSGWKWLFLIEALPTLVLGVICFVSLDNKPVDANWLTQREKDIVQSALDRDHAGEAVMHGSQNSSITAALFDARVWLLALIYFATACANYTYTFWIPTIIKSLGVSDVASIGWLSAIPYAFAAAGVLVISASSDRLKERRWHVGGTLILSAIGLAFSTTLQSSLTLSLVVLSLVAFVQFGAGITFWSIPPTYLRRETAAVGIGLVSSIGVVGGFISPALLGYIKNETGSLAYGIYFVAAVMVVGGLLTLYALPKQATRVAGAD
jgi:D-galactonate transporter